MMTLKSHISEILSQKHEIKIMTQSHNYEIIQIKMQVKFIR